VAIGQAIMVAWWNEGSEGPAWIRTETIKVREEGLRPKHSGYEGRPKRWGDVLVKHDRLD
jgi:hypothetical protein